MIDGVLVYSEDGVEYGVANDTGASCVAKSPDLVAVDFGLRTGVVSVDVWLVCRYSQQLIGTLLPLPAISNALL